MVAMLYCGELFLSFGSRTDMTEAELFIKTIPHFSVISDAPLKTEGNEQILYHMAGKFDKSEEGERLVTEDYAAVYGVLADAFGLSGGGDFERWYTDTCHRVRHGVSRLLMLRDGDVPSAVCTVLYSGRHGAFLSHVGVKKAAQGKGLGRKIISAAGSMYGDISLLCAQKTRGFYERCGLTCIAEAYGYLKDGEER